MWTPASKDGSPGSRPHCPLRHTQAGPAALSNTLVRVVFSKEEIIFHICERENTSQIETLGRKGEFYLLFLSYIVFIFVSVLCAHTHTLLHPWVEIRPVLFHKPSGSLVSEVRGRSAPEVPAAAACDRRSWRALP